jgi:ABC-type antimicrobial peptide transport system ATPase subunit
LDLAKSNDLKLLSEYIDEDQDKLIEQAVTRVVGRVLDGYEDKMKVMVVGIARRKIKAMVKMVDIIDILLGRLSDLNTNMLEDLNSSQVIRLLSELNGSINNDLGFIMKLVSPDSDLKDLQVYIDQRQVNVNGSSAATEVKAEQILQMTGVSRDKIRDAFDALLNNIDVPNYEDVPQTSKEDDE